MQADVVFLIALYRNDGEVWAFIRQLSLQSYKDIWVYVVCNAALDVKLFNLRVKEFGFVTVLFPGKNLGYFGAARFALEHHKSNHSIPELTIVCNSDLKISDVNFINGLVEHTGADNVAAIAPSVVSSFTGRDMNPYLTERYSRKYLQMLKSVYSFYPAYVLYETAALVKSKLQDKPKRESRSTETYAVYGACIAFTKAFFERGGKLDFGAFLYGEEIFVAEQAKQLGMTVLHDSRLQIVHEEHSTTGFIKSPRHVRYLHESIAFILKAFYDERK